MGAGGVGDRDPAGLRESRLLDVLTAEGLRSVLLLGGGLTLLLLRGGGPLDRDRDGDLDGERDRERESGEALRCLLGGGGLRLRLSPLNFLLRSPTSLLGGVYEGDITRRLGGGDLEAPLLDTDGDLLRGIDSRRRGGGDLR